MLKGFKQQPLFQVSAALLVISSVAIFVKIGSQSFSKRDISEFTVLVESGSLPGFITASGELKALRSVNISPDKQGILKFIFVN